MAGEVVAVVAVEVVVAAGAAVVEVADLNEPGKARFESLQHLQGHPKGEEEEEKKVDADWWECRMEKRQMLDGDCSDLRKAK